MSSGSEAISSTGVHDSWWHEERKQDQAWWDSLAKEVPPSPRYEARRCTCGSSLWRRIATGPRQTEGMGGIEPIENGGAMSKVEHEPSTVSAVGAVDAAGKNRRDEDITQPVPRDEVNQAAIDAWHAVWRALSLEDKRIALNRYFQRSVEGVLTRFLLPDHPRSRPALDDPEALNREPDAHRFCACAAMLCARLKAKPFQGHHDYAAWLLDVFSTLRHQLDVSEEENTRRSCWFRFLNELCKRQFEASYGRFLDVKLALQYEAKHPWQDQLADPPPGWTPATPTGH